MKKTFSLLSICMIAMLVPAQQIRVLSNQKVADGWNPQFTENASVLMYSDEENFDIPRSDMATDIYVGNEDLQIVLYRDGERQVLAPHGTDVNYIWISLSPDRQKILFNTLYGTGVCDLEGKELVNLGHIDAPVWCGNDKVVGMLDTHDGDFYTSSCIAIRSLDGKLDQQLTDPQEMGMYPAVSAETGMIAYSTLSGEVHLMKTDLAGKQIAKEPVIRKVTPLPQPFRAPRAQYTSASQVKIYINPGHGGHDSDDRPMTIYPFKAGDPEGFWESNSNLDKGLKLNEWLIREGFQTKMSRTLNRTEDDRALSAIVAEANAYGADYMLSIHSNAGGPSNYVLELYSGQDQNDTRTYRNPAPRQDESRAISTVIAKYLTKNQVTTWSPASRANGWVIGDKTFGYTIMGGWGDGYGVLRKLAVPGCISEGCMHDYIPETYRLMNMDYKWREAFYFMTAFCEYFLDYKLPYGAIGGQVRDWYKKIEFPKMTKISGSRDELLPICGAKVTLLKDGTEKATYTTDELYNGVFFFWDLEPGEYTLRCEAEHYYTMEKTVTVVAGDIVYQDMLVNARRETPPEVISWTPYVKDITDSVDVATDIVFNFNWDMKEEETRAAFSIEPEVEGTISFENSYRTLRFKPARMFEKETEYTVTLKKTACHPDTNYVNTMTEDFVLRFRTKNRQVLSVLQNYPDNNATDVPLRPQFIILFDENVNAASGRQNVVVQDMQGTNLSINSRMYNFNKLNGTGDMSFELVNALEPDADYKLLLLPDLQDQKGVYLNRTLEIPFHTQPATDEHAGNMVNNMESLSFAYYPDASMNVQNASTFLNKTRKYAGSAANELKYTFGDDEALAIYRYSADELLNGNSNCRMGMYVCADYSGNELQAIWDAQGDIQYTTVCMLDYAGWHYEETDLSVLPAGVDYQFTGLRIVRHEGVMSGNVSSVLVDNMYFLRQEPTGVDNIQYSDIAVYPNPASSAVFVSGLTAPATLQMYSLDGKHIRSAYGSIMPVENIPDGMYMLHVTTEKENIVRSVIIKH